MRGQLVFSLSVPLFLSLFRWPDTLIVIVMLSYCKQASECLFNVDSTQDKSFAECLYKCKSGSTRERSETSVVPLTRYSLHRSV